MKRLFASHQSMGDKADLSCGSSAVLPHFELAFLKHVHHINPFNVAYAVFVDLNSRNGWISRFSFLWSASMALFQYLTWRRFHRPRTFARALKL